MYNYDGKIIYLIFSFRKLNTQSLAKWWDVVSNWKSASHFIEFWESIKIFNLFVLRPMAGYWLGGWFNFQRFSIANQGRSRTTLKVTTRSCRGILSACLIFELLFRPLFLREIDTFGNIDWINKTQGCHKSRDKRRIYGKFSYALKFFYTTEFIADMQLCLRLLDMQVGYGGNSGIIIKNNYIINEYC